MILNSITLLTCISLCSLPLLKGNDQILFPGPSTLSLAPSETDHETTGKKSPPLPATFISPKITPLVPPSSTESPTSDQSLTLADTHATTVENVHNLVSPPSQNTLETNKASLTQPKEILPLPVNALSRLRAARAKYQGKQEPSNALAKPDAPTPNNTSSNNFTISPNIASISITSSPNQGDQANPKDVLTLSPLNENLNEKISLQFPHTSIMEVLALYEKLTGKHIIRDSTLNGPGTDLSIMITDPVSKKEAISVIESSMLLNGYVVVPVDEQTVKVLGATRPPRTEGLPLYLEESEIPSNGDQFLSFYQPLHFLSTTEAINILQGVVQLNPFGSLVAVPNTSAIVITDKTPIIRKALALLKVIDHESSQIITDFIPLQRADAEKTVETLNQIFGKENSSLPTTVKGSSQPVNPNNQPPSPAGDSSNPGDERVFSGKVQFIADKRTNRILVVTRKENYRYVRELIANLDKAQSPEEPLVRSLNYISSSELFPVLVDMLKNKDDDTTQNQAKAQQTPQNPFNNSGSSGLLGSQNPLDSSSPSSGASAGGSHADRLTESTKQSPPQSAIVGATSIVADPTANSIIVYGPSESKAKAGQIIDLLDRRPQQVYLAAVIGEMTLSEGMDYGASYLFHYQGFNSLANTFGGTAADALLSGINSALSGTNSTSSSNSSVSSTVSKSTDGGLTLFGSVGGSVDMYARFLESTGKFHAIARPTVYTSNNKKATILSGRKIPYESSSLNNVVNSTTNQVAGAITSNVTYQDVLLKLEVIPLINSDKEVSLVIAQQNQSVNSEGTKLSLSNGIKAPVINTQELTTSVRIPSGATIVLGGLISDEKENDDKGIPYINRVPILGPLLGNHTVKSKVRRELVVMIQPIVIDSNDSMIKASDREGGASDLGMEAKGLEKKLEPTPKSLPKNKKKKFKLFSLPKTNGNTE